MSLLILLLWALLILAVAAGAHILGAWLLAKIGAGEPFRIVWSVVVVVFAILALIQLLGGRALVF